MRLIVILSFLVGGLALGHGLRALADGPAPMFVVEPHQADYVHGHHWPLGAEVTLNIDDPSNGPGIDYTDTKTVVEQDGDTVVSFWTGQAFYIVPGLTVSLSTDGLQKSTVVTYLYVTDVDAALDTVSGMAAPYSEVEVVIAQFSYGLRRETADPTGYWRADFSVPGVDPDEQDVVDLGPDDGVIARQIDPDGDQTADHWPMATINQVAIDIKPGSDPNCFNNDGHGVIPVAILTTATFDAATVDPFSVALDGASASVKGKSGNAGSLEDVDGDGDLDLVVQIEDVDGTYVVGDTIATLSGLTFEGYEIEGTDSICVVP